MEKQPRDEAVFLKEIGIAIWTNLPLLLLIDTVLLIAAIALVFLIATGALIVVPIAGALMLGPIWAGTIAVTDRICLGEVVTTRDLLQATRQFIRCGIAVSLVPASVATLLLGTLQIIASHPQDRWLLVPLFIDGTMLTLTIVAGFFAYSLATTGGMRGGALWRASLLAVGTNVLQTVGALSILALMWVAAQLLGPLVPVLLAAPFGLFLSAISVNSCGMRTVDLAASDI